MEQEEGGRFRLVIASPGVCQRMLEATFSAAFSPFGRQPLGSVLSVIMQGDCWSADVYS
jgi:hypothetical protein